MKGIRNMIVSGSLQTFVVSFAAFIISALVGCNGVLVLSGLVASVAFAVFFSAADFTNNDAYVSRCRRS